MKIDISRAWVDITEIGFGTTMLCCFAREFLAPVGFLTCQRYGVQDGKSAASISHLYVIPEWRRNGVAKRLLSELAAQTQILITGVGSEDGGKALIQSFGFTYDKLSGHWIYREKTSKTRK